MDNELPFINSRIVLARTTRGFSQQDLATLADLTQSQLSRIESGQTSEPSVLAVSAIARALNISLDTLMSASGDEFMASLVQTQAKTNDLEIGYGISLYTNRPFVLRRFAEEVLTPHMLLLGKAGSGKSFAIKAETLSWALASANTAVVDVTGEYRPLVQALQGATLDLGHGQTGTLNLLDFSTAGEVNLTEKIGYVAQAVVALLKDTSGQDVSVDWGQRKQFVQAAVKNVYAAYGFDESTDQQTLKQTTPDRMPTLGDVRQALLRIVRQLAPTSPNQNALNEFAREIIEAFGPWCQALDENHAPGDFAQAFDGPSTLDGSKQSLLHIDLSNIDRTHQTRAYAFALEQARTWWFNYHEEQSPRLLVLEHAHLLGDTAEDDFQMLEHLLRTSRGYDIAISMALEKLPQEQKRQKLLLGMSYFKLFGRMDYVTVSELQNWLQISYREASQLQSLSVGNACLFAGSQRHWLNLQTMVAPEAYDLVVRKTGGDVSTQVDTLLLEAICHQGHTLLANNNNDSLETILMQRISALIDPTMHLMQRVLDEVSISAYFSHLGFETQYGLGGKSSCLCPFHKEETPSMFVYENDQSNTWRCFGACDRSGTVVDAAMLAEGFTSVHEAVVHLAGLYGISQ